MFSKFLNDRVQLVINNNSNLPLFFNDKVQTHYYCMKNDIPTTLKYFILNSLDDIEESIKSLNKDFVIKPSHLSSTVGVMVLSRVENDNRFFEHLHQAVVDLNYIIKYQEKKFKEIDLAEKFIIIEERVDDKYVKGVPLDFKVYTFYDQIGLICIIDRNHEKLYVDWYDSSFNPVDDSLIRNVEPYAYKKPDPINIKEKHKLAIINFAIKYSKIIGLPFLSMDLYLKSDGEVLLGEVTLSPGGLHYQKIFKISEELNEKLGSFWIDSLRKTK